MMEKTAFGLIGKNISYSFSKRYFENKFQRLMLKDHAYELYDLQDIADVDALFLNRNLRGLNVTIPFKEKIIPFLDELSDEARQTGAVNCISINNNIKTGYNTDVFGFEKTILLHRNENHRSAIILGNGGAAKAVQYVLSQNGIDFITVSRKSEQNFENLSPETVAEHLLIVQCTPVGTFPNVEDFVPFPFGSLTERHLVIDLIYNPSETAFIRNAAQQGAKTVNGLYMLEQQAENKKK